MERSRRSSAQRAASMVLAAVVALGAGAAAQPAAAAPAGPALSAHGVAGFRLADIPAKDGVVLKADVFTPSPGTPGADPQGRYPLVVQPASWGQNDLEYIAQGRALAEDGYVVVTYTVRGFWASGGEVDVAGPEDVADISAVIDWALARTPADPQRVGMVGLSLGGGLTLLGAAFDPRIKAVASLSGWADLTDSLYSGQTRHLQAAAVLAGIQAPTGRRSPEFAQVLDDLFANRDLPRIIRWADTRSPARYLDRINANGTAVLLANAWGDGFFNPGQITDFYERLTVPKRLELRPGDHASQEFTGLLGLPNAAWDSARSWLDQHLRAAPADRRRPVDLEVRPTGRHESHPDWQSVATRTDHVTVGADALGGPAAGEWRRTVLGGLPSGANGGVTLLSGAVDQALHQPPTVLVPLLARPAAGVWQSQPYLQGLSVRGAARLHTSVTASGPNGTAVAYLYDVDALGVGRLISHGPQSWTGRTPGVPFPLDVTLFATAYDVPAGHHLALVLGTRDALYGTTTPLGSTVTFTSTPADPSELTLPLR
ncbi:CocE/NonD family hydrolase [Kitasatospora sp. A2-31]|uniref:CocE/NonD family hydrolase n=2 Tax=Kitasatospora sp. A2-31 TaxID=2916414 RepID=UPI001EEA5495|nr:CocE/NonD family hydrolase [Kitasatospora sp. A2-31]MCG6494133.1 CocE/NonD family hydrolase [Kitasatospora sp. A2-31]